MTVQPHHPTQLNFCIIFLFTKPFETFGVGFINPFTVYAKLLCLKRGAVKLGIERKMSGGAVGPVQVDRTVLKQVRKHFKIWYLGVVVLNLSRSYSKFGQSSLVSHAQITWSVI